MKIVSTGKMNLPKESIFLGLTDINYLKSEIAKYSSNNPKIQYNRKNPFGEGNSIFFDSDGPHIRVKVIKSDPSDFIQLEFSGDKKVTDFIGYVIYTAQLESVGDKTKYTFTYESSKDPSLIITKLVAYIFMFFIRLSLFKANIKFRKYVKQKYA